MKKIEVVCAIIIEENKVLCCQKKKGKLLGELWEFPGGKVEVNETNEEALVREIKEELNVNIKVKKYLITSIYKYDFAEIVLHAYECSCDTYNEIQLVDHQEAIWLNKEDIKQLDWAPADIEICDYIIKEC